MQESHIQKQRRYTVVEDLGSLGLVLVEMSMGSVAFSNLTGEFRDSDRALVRHPKKVDKLLDDLLLANMDELSPDAKSAVGMVPHEVLRYLMAVKRYQIMAAGKPPPQQGASSAPQLVQRPSQSEVFQSIHYRKLRELF